MKVQVKLIEHDTANIFVRHTCTNPSVMTKTMYWPRVSTRNLCSWKDDHLIHPMATFEKFMTFLNPIQPWGGAII